jgi:hypothetical protein
MTVHHINQPGEDLIVSSSDAANGDTFDITANSAGMALWGLSDTTIRFTGSGESATLIDTGPTKIYDMGHGTRLTLASGDSGVITIYDFQDDKTGYIQNMETATLTGHLTPESDHHGGLYLTGVGLTVHLVNDPSIAASQHS